jgi:hypothetical protein
MVELAKGKPLTFTFPDGPNSRDPGFSATIRIGAEVAVSLRTTDRETCKQRHAMAATQLDQFLAILKNGPQPLTHKQRLAIAGLAYRHFVGEHEEDPGSHESWEIMRDLHTDALLDEDRGEGPPGGLEKTYGATVDMVLREATGMGDVLNAIRPGHPSRAALVREVVWVLAEAAERLRKNALGDYSKDKTAKRFPAPSVASTPQSGKDASPIAVELAPKQPHAPPSPAPSASSTTESLPLTDLFEKWRLEVKPAASTVTNWRSSLRAFIRRLGRNVSTTLRQPVC